MRVTKRVQINNALSLGPHRERKLCCKYKRPTISHYVTSSYILCHIIISHKLCCKYKRPTISQKRERPIHMAKEAYYLAKETHHRANETYLHGKRDPSCGKRNLFICQKSPIIWQKRPIYMAKETYYGPESVLGAEYTRVQKDKCTQTK